MPHISIEQAIEDIRAGKMVILADGSDPESEGDFCMAAEKVTPRPSTSWPSTAGASSVCPFRSESPIPGPAAHGG